jgi:predicted alpha/beta-hydrolase family hydrolase
VDMLFDWVERSAPTLVLAHGAGAPMDSPFLQHFSLELSQRGVNVARFEFPYMAQRRTGGSKRPPNRQPELIASWQTALTQVKQQVSGAVFIGGKSMGGRMAAVLAAQIKVPGLLCLGYPFHPVGKPDTLRVATLAQLTCQALVVQGTRDKLGAREEVDGYALPSNINLHWLADGDHDFKPRVRSGYRHQQHIATAAHVAADFIKGLA